MLSRTVVLLRPRKLNKIHNPVRKTNQVSPYPTAASEAPQETSSTSLKCSESKPSFTTQDHAGKAYTHSTPEAFPASILIAPSKLSLLYEVKWSSFVDRFNGQIRRFNDLAVTIFIVLSICSIIKKRIEHVRKEEEEINKQIQSILQKQRELHSKTFKDIYENKEFTLEEMSLILYNSSGNLNKAKEISEKHTQGPIDFEESHNKYEAVQLTEKLIGGIVWLFFVTRLSTQSRKEVKEIGELGIELHLAFENVDIASLEIEDSNSL